MNDKRIAEIGNLEINLEELAGFLVEAKKQGYAGDGEERIMSDGSKQQTFQRGNYFYVDSYLGYYRISGKEEVRWQGSKKEWTWRMLYCGGMLPKYHGDKELAEKVFGFLKEALMEVPIKLPFRGPIYFGGKEFVYYNEIIHASSLDFFKGAERIFIAEESKHLFELNYIGGLIIPK